ILCYPNPTTGKVNIKLNKHYPDLSLALMDLFGRTILQKHFTDTQNIELELSSQPGLYFVTLNSADGWSKTIPVVKK
ncbi:MAG TPA: T9SS type A sorting domain-containing protein, partial [Saprospiraceae bacterium]|nr:T9SS type A sorting domain-containing protein [Saprospiraceae bacterium]